MQESTDREIRILDDGATIGEIVAFVRAQFFWIVALLFLGAVAGGLLSYTQPRQWQAESILRLGQVEEEAVTPIEPPALTTERIRSEAFRQKLLQQLSLPIQPGVDRRADLVTRTLQAEVVPNTNLIRLSVRDLTPEQAVATIKAAQQQVTSLHQQLFDETIARLRARQQDIEAQVAANEAGRRNQADSIRAASKAAAGDAAVRGLLADIADVSSRTFLESLRAKSAELTRKLGSDRSFTTTPLAEVVPPQRPSGPRRILYVMLGGLIGLLGGLLLGAFKHARAAY